LRVFQVPSARVRSALLALKLRLSLPSWIVRPCATLSICRPIISDNPFFSAVPTIYADGSDPDFPTLDELQVVPLILHVIPSGMPLSLGPDVLSPHATNAREVAARSSSNVPFMNRYPCPVIERDEDYGVISNGGR
jgi:hypothetical protein